ncbi:hypothetical protein diail_8975 [Diaporthe ilicicola]|nr:hypothetical protein diail_8975 [Diaporthe ilicicola]
MATLHQNLLNSNATLKKASLSVDYFVSPTLAYVLQFIANNNAVPNSAVEPLDYLSVLENIGVQLHAHNAAKVCGVDSIVWESMDEDDKQLTITILSEIIRQECIAVRDESCPSRYFIGPVDILQLVDSTTSNSKPPRPPNPFIIYRSERHQSVKDAHPDLKNNDISKMLGKQWQNESKEVRDAYKKKSEDIKEEFMRVHPDYKYQPRKSSEVKRRNRRAANNSQ